MQNGAHPARASACSKLKASFLVRLQTAVQQLFRSARYGNRHTRMDLICNPYEIIIQGVTESGKVFRPSDWSERLAGILCSFGEDNKIAYSRYLRPIMLNSTRCLAVERSLEDFDPRAFQFLMGFARDNHLRIMDCKTLIDKVEAGEIRVQQLAAPQADTRSSAA